MSDDIKAVPSAAFLADLIAVETAIRDRIDIMWDYDGYSRQSDRVSELRGLAAALAGDPA